MIVRDHEFYACFLTLQLRWGLVKEADEYRVIISETEVPGTFKHVSGVERRTEAFRINQGTITGLKPGTNYAIIASGVRNGNRGKNHPYIFPWTVPNAVDVSTITTNTRVDANANHQVDIYFDPPKVGGHDSFKAGLKIVFRGNFGKEIEIFGQKTKFLGTIKILPNFEIFGQI